MSVFTDGEFLLPKNQTDYEKWSVVACDQYTSAPEYWDELGKRIGDAPSTLNLICPEAYLSRSDERLPLITTSAEKYVKDFLAPVCGMILTCRTLVKVKRYGLVVLADLEKYSFTDATAMIRATEGTVTERIPPRLKVRRASRLDVSHVICLIDDEKESVIEPLIGTGEKLYDFSLGVGGRLEGWLIKDTASVKKAFELLERDTTEKGLPFALVGDGNHSLASGKALYEELLKMGDERAKRARYAVVEVENLRSSSVVFEPIHRILYNAPDFREYLQKMSGEVKRIIVDGEDCEYSAPKSEIATYSVVQKMIDEYLSSHPQASVDYIHGEDELRRLCKEKKGVGIVMPTVGKGEFFEYVALNGVLPRKTFSMGEAHEKRYYTEAHDIGTKK